MKPSWRVGRELDLMILLPAFAFIMLAALCAAVYYQVSEERANAIKETQAKSQELARSFAERSAQILHQADHISQLFKVSFESSPAAFTLAQFTRKNGAINSALPYDIDIQISLVNQHGEVIDCTQPFQPYSVAGQTFFQDHARRVNDVLLIDKPVDARSKRWSILLSRRLNHPDGSFAGVVMVTLDPTSFIDNYDISELGTQGMLILNSPQEKRSIWRIGDKISQDERLDLSALHPPEPLAQNLSLQQAGLDGIARVYGNRELIEFGVVVMVGLTGKEQFAQSGYRQKIYIWAMALVSILFALFVIGLLRQTYRLRNSLQVAKEAKSMLHAAAEGSLDAFYILKCCRDTSQSINDFEFLDLNQRAEKMLGLPRAQIIGQKLSQLLPTFRSSNYFANYVQVVQSGQPMEEEFEVNLLQTGPKWLQHQIVTIGDGVAITARDITERKQKELENRNNRNFLQSLIDHLPLLVCVKSMRAENPGQFVVWNKTAEITTGYLASDIVGKTNNGAFAIDVVQKYNELEKSMMDNPMIMELSEMPTVRADGQTRYLHLIAVPLFDDHNQVEYILSIGEDVTRRRQTEMALLESEARLRTIADTLPTMVAYIDAEQRYRFHNLAFERDVGYAVHNALGKTVREIVGPARYQFLQPYIERVLQGERLSFEEESIQGEVYRCIECTYIPQASQDGNSIVGFHVMRQDISATKLEEKRLTQLAQIDVLTGLSNRAGFQQRLADAMAKSRREQNIVAVMYMDIDHFKPVNDTYGHDVGDALLQAFSQRLLHAFRTSDTVARMGGDEFTIIMESVKKPEDAATLAAKVVQAMRVPFDLDGITVTVSTSIGVAFYQGGPESGPDLLKQADSMLYQAKRAGRNTWRAAELTTCIG